MKNINTIFLLLTSNLIIAMEAERKSLASFFCAEQFTEHADICKVIAQQSPSDKQWWYVDKEIQFFGKYYGSNHSLLSIYPNYLKCVCFDSTGTKIIAFPSLDNDYLAYTYDRDALDNDYLAYTYDRDGKKLESLSYDFFYVLCENNIAWANNLCESGNYICPHNDLDEVAELLKKRFGYGTKQFYNEQQAFVVPKFQLYDGDRIHAWNQAEDIILFTLRHNDVINSLDFNPQGIEIITASSDKSMCLWNKKTGQQLLCINYDKRVTSASFNAMGTEMVVATDDGNIQIFAQYKTDNLQQILLKKLLHLWLQLKAPNKTINSSEKLLDTVAQMLRCNYDELCNTWKSFPENIRNAIWASMYKKIQRYGK